MHILAMIVSDGVISGIEGAAILVASHSHGRRHDDRLSMRTPAKLEIGLFTKYTVVY
jgi:hypothetical protein